MFPFSGNFRTIFDDILAFASLKPVNSFKLAEISVEVIWDYFRSHYLCSLLKSDICFDSGVSNVSQKKIIYSFEGAEDKLGGQ